MELHVNLDVAFAFLQYAWATGDSKFLRTKAWPVLEGVAEWVESRVERGERGYEIRNLTGVNEGVDNINNNAMTNMLASKILREATKLSLHMGFQPPSAWEDIAANIVIPVNWNTGALEAYEGDQNHTVFPAPDTLSTLVFPFGLDAAPGVKEATLKLQMSLAHRSLGNPMHSAFYSAWAARHGDRALSLKALELGILPRVLEPFLMLSESSNKGCCYDINQPACFLTDMGGLLQTILIGLTGLTITEEAPSNWTRHPVVLPEGWESIEVERIFARGKTVSLSAKHGVKRADFRAE